MSHALLSPSASHRWIECPPSVRLTELMEDKPSSYADEGTLAHSIAENKLNNYLGYTDKNVKCEDTSMDEYTDDYVAFVAEQMRVLNNPSVLGLPEQKLKEGKELIKYFCVPCAPTKANGGRMRNLPRHAPEKWAQFKAYNKRDVEVEMSIQDRLRKFPVPDFLWEEYCLDQQINDRGIALDMAVVENAILFDENSRGVLSAKMQELTALENPNSVQQMKQWLSENGLKVDSLGKKEVAAILKTAPPQLAEVLELRQQLAKSSVKKYQAMRNAVCSDGRAHGMFQFYGANRSGRWAGRLIQLQNLPQNHM